MAAADAIKQLNGRRISQNASNSTLFGGL